MARIIFLI